MLYPFLLEKIKNWIINQKTNFPIFFSFIGALTAVAGSFISVEVFKQSVKNNEINERPWILITCEQEQTADCATITKEPNGNVNFDFKFKFKNIGKTPLKIEELKINCAPFNCTNEQNVNDFCVSPQSYILPGQELPCESYFKNLKLADPKATTTPQFVVKYKSAITNKEYQANFRGVLKLDEKNATLRTYWQIIYAD